MSENIFGGGARISDARANSIEEYAQDCPPRHIVGTVSKRKLTAPAHYRLRALLLAGLAPQSGQLFLQGGVFLLHDFRPQRVPMAQVAPQRRCLAPR